MPIQSAVITEEKLTKNSKRTGAIHKNRSTEGGKTLNKNPFKLLPLRASFALPNRLIASLPQHTQADSLVKVFMLLAFSWADHLNLSCPGQWQGNCFVS